MPGWRLSRVAQFIVRHPRSLESMFGLKSKGKKIVTPLGEATIHGGIVCVSLWRYRGVLIDVQWKDVMPAPVDQVQEIRAAFDHYVDLSFAELGVSEFPAELRTIVPESIDFLLDDVDWSLCFRCTEWPDAWWTVDYRNGEIVGHRHGD
jgi:hypothetical protein